MDLPSRGTKTRFQSKIKENNKQVLAGSQFTEATFQAVIATDEYINSERHVVFEINTCSKTYSV